MLAPHGRQAVQRVATPLAEDGQLVASRCRGTGGASDCPPVRMASVRGSRLVGSDGHGLEYAASRQGFLADGG